MSIFIFRTKAFAGTLAACATLTACGPSAPTEVEKVQALPAIPMSEALAHFERVCVRNGADASGGDVIFSRKAGQSGSTCSMRSRAPAGVDEFSELRRRYGNARNSGLLTLFPGYPHGTLIFLQGIKNGAGEGTFQIAIQK